MRGAGSRTMRGGRVQGGVLRSGRYERGRRVPRTVSMAVALLLVTVLIEVTAVGFMVQTVQGDIQHLIARGSYAIEGMSAEEHLAAQVRDYRMMQAAFLLPGALVAFLSVVLSLFLLRGRRGARTAVWVFSGVLLAVSVGALIIFSLFALTLERHVSLSDVLIPVQAGLLAVGYGLVIVLLALPQSRTFFPRRPAATRSPDLYQR